MITRVAGFGVLLSLTLGQSGCSSSSPDPGAKPESANRPELTNVYQVGPVVDLLAQVDPQRDSVLGEFRREEGSLIIPAVRSAQLNLDVELPEQYELFLDVARTRGNESLNLGISVGGHQAVVVIEGWGNRTSGLNRVDGRLGQDNETSSQFPVFKDASPQSIRIIVRRESVLVDVNGNVFIDFRGDPSRLSFDDRYFQRPEPDQLMLGGWETEFRVSKWTLTPFGDQPVDYASSTSTAVAAREAASPASSARDPSPPATEPVAKPALADPLHEVPDDVVMGDGQNGRVAGTPDEAEQAKGGERIEAIEPEAWQATVDPYPGWSGSAASRISIPLPTGWVVVPDGPSPYFLVGATSGEMIRWSVFDVRTGSSVGTACELPADLHFYPKLCSSGRYMSSYTRQGSERQIAVHSFVSGRQVYAAESPTVRFGDTPRDCLASNHRLLQLRGSDEDIELQWVDLRSEHVRSSWSIDSSDRELIAIAITPGGREIAVIYRYGVEAYDLYGARLVGRIRAPAGLSLEGAFAFTIDGTELALLGWEDDRPTPTLWCIDWGTGETTLLANLHAEVHGLQNNYLFGPALAWFPGKELLLYYGRDVIDRRTGKFCYRIPSNVYWQSPRRTLGSRSILGMMPGDDPDHRDYRSISLDGTGLDAALEVVRQGGIAEDVGLPPLTVAGSGSGKVIESQDNTGCPTVAREARPTFPDQGLPLPMLLAQMKNWKAELRRIEFADPPETTAIVHFTIDDDDDDKRQDIVTRFDLKRGKPSGSIPIRKDFRLAAVSPDGRLALLGLFNQVDGYRRLDVVDLANQRHVAGWRPFHGEVYAEDISATGQPEARNPMTANWVRFVDNSRVITVNPEGRLVCWRIPDCSAVFTVEDFGDPLALSADRRYLAGAKSTYLQMLDVQSGVWAGKLEPQEPPQTILRAGFAPDNGELAAVVGYQGRRTLVFWDLARGVPVEQFDLPYVTVSPGWSEHQHDHHRQLGLDFRRSGYLTLDDLYLIDRAGKSVPWLYSPRRGKHVVNGPDDREWFTEHQIANHGQGQIFEFWLTAAELPSDRVIAMIRSATASSAERPIGRSVLSMSSEEVELVP